MTDVVLTAISLAGFLFAQVTTVVSELPTSSVTPVALVVAGDTQQFRFFEGSTLEAMVENGRRELKSQKYDAWSFAYEGYVVIAGTRKSALFIEAWVRGASHPVVIAQVWRHSSDGAVALVGAPFLLPRDKSPEAGRIKPMGPVPLSPMQERAFEAGISRHKELKNKHLIG